MWLTSIELFLKHFPTAVVRLFYQICSNTDNLLTVTQDLCPFSGIPRTKT
jgi:hypothetical protein